MDDPPDHEPPADAPGWAFYSLWPRMMDGGPGDGTAMALAERTEVTETAARSP